jgi:putative phosphoribosyl transferase
VVIFRDRKDAGRQLAAALIQKHLPRPLVLAIPRGGVPVAAEIADALAGDLSVIVARKLGAPGNPEFAIGAITATGVSYMNPGLAAIEGADERYIAAEKERQTKEAQRREQLFNPHRRPSVLGRTVVLVDDGIATGATAVAAMRSIKAERPARVMLAVPVGASEALNLLRGEADDIVCLEEDPNLRAVGDYYRNFNQIDDEEVREILDLSAPALTIDPRLYTDHWIMAPMRRVWISRDEVHLAAILGLPCRTGPFPLVIFVHGPGSGKKSPRDLTIASYLGAEGIATLLFDLSGHGESSSDICDGNDAYIKDVEAVFGWAKRRPEVRPELIGIAGSGLGAAIALRALAEEKVSPSSMVLRALPLERAALRDVMVPSLILIGSLDPLLPRVEREADGAPYLTLAVIEGAGHLFDEPGALAEAADRTVCWFKSRLLSPVRWRATGPQRATQVEAAARKGGLG